MYSVAAPLGMCANLVPGDADCERALLKDFRCHAHPRRAEANLLFQVQIDAVRNLPTAEPVRTAAEPVAPVRIKRIVFSPLGEIHRPGNVGLILKAKDRVVVAGFQFARPPRCRADPSPSRARSRCPRPALPASTVSMAPRRAAGWNRRSNRACWEFRGGNVKCEIPSRA